MWIEDVFNIKQNEDVVRQITSIIYYYIVHQFVDDKIIHNMPIDKANKRYAIYVHLIKM